MTDALIMQLMRRAIDESKKAVSEADKNSPKVGAALFHNGQLLGAAYRGQDGEGDHAEYTLLEKVLNGVDVTGSTLFTTLEPCTARKKHKTCAEWILEKHISHVYIGDLDPNPDIYNKGCGKLRAAGVAISFFPPALRDEIRNVNVEFIGQYHANPALEGTASFNYSDNDGNYRIGNNDLLFETKWSKGSDTAIYAYNNLPSIPKIAIANGHQSIVDIVDGSVFDSTSRSRLVNQHQILILQNAKGYYAAVKVLEIIDSQRAPANDKLTLEYQILTDHMANFATGK